MLSKIGASPDLTIIGSNTIEYNPAPRFWTPLDTSIPFHHAIMVAVFLIGSSFTFLSPRFLFLCSSDSNSLQMDTKYTILLPTDRLRNSLLK